MKLHHKYTVKIPSTRMKNLCAFDRMFTVAYFLNKIFNRSRGFDIFIKMFEKTKFN